MAKVFNIMPMWQNFDKSGHTGTAFEYGAQTVRPDWAIFGIYLQQISFQKQPNILSSCENHCFFNIKWLCYFLGNLEKLGLLFISPSGHTVYRVASEDDDLLSSVKTANSQRKKIIKILKEQKSGYKKFSRKFQLSKFFEQFSGSWLNVLNLKDEIKKGERRRS